MFLHAWRWFGHDDPVSLDQVVQTGATCIVSALHQVPVGEVWSREEIRRRADIIRKAGLKWGVVESVPVHEDIKTRSGHYIKYIENYKQTLLNLASEEVHTVCYNFMPALDWSRTSLNSRQPDGSELSSFNQVHFAAIDLHLLHRPGAEENYPEEVIRRAHEFHTSLNSREKEELLATFLLGFPGSGEAFSVKEVLQRIHKYNGVGKEEYQGHLARFLREIVPVAEEAGIHLAIHPDDPPWPLLGLPRAVSTLEDVEKIIAAVDSPANGITFCSGSFGAAHTNDLPAMASKLAHRIHFLHLRNVSRDAGNNFRETNLFEGDVDLFSIMQTMVQEDLRREKMIPGYRGLPVRPDHGARILDDLQKNYYPGYSLYGRMKNLAEIRGLEMGVRRSIQNSQSTHT
jgi:mannonate dehydratase